MSKRTILFTSAVLASFLLCDLFPRGQAARAAVFAPKQDTDDDPPFNVPTRTLGGVEFWADEVIQRGWRIQRNMVTGHCRLLDPGNTRQAWGTKDHCQTALQTVARRSRWNPSRGRVVLVLHGLGSFRGRMNHLVHALSELPETEVYGVGYPSLLGDVDSHAQRLADVLDCFPEAQEICFVGHSLGNIVVRRLLAMQMEANGDGKHDERVKRIVMITPPNNGSLRAELWASNKIFQTVFGETGQQLGAKWGELAKTLATPQCEFGIIAGARGDGQGWSETIPGDDDGTLGIETTRLPGADDFIVVPVRHTKAESHEDVLKYAAKFLQHGYFISADAKTPIEPRTEVMGPDGK